MYFSFLFLPLSLPLPLPAWKIHTLAHTENLTVSWSDPATRSNMGQHLAMKKPLKPCENSCSRLFCEEMTELPLRRASNKSCVKHSFSDGAPWSLSLQGTWIPVQVGAATSSCWILLPQGVLGFFSTTWVPLELFLSSRLWNIRCRFHAWVSNQSLISLATPLL